MAGFLIRHSFRAAAVPLVVLAWQTAVLGQAPGSPQIPDATRPTAAPATASGATETAADAITPSLPPKPRGNGALFGASNTANAARSLAIDATVAISAAYDDDLSEGQTLSSLLTPVGGEYSDLTPSLTVSRKRARSLLNARASTSVRHYPSLDRLIGSSYSAGSDLRFDVSSRTTLQAGVDGTYTSEFAFDNVSRQSGLGNVTLSSAGLDMLALDRSRVSYGVTGGINRQVGMHTNVTLTASTRESERPIFHEFASEQSIGSTLARRIGRDSSMRLNYLVHHFTQRFADRAQPAWSNDFEVGIDHHWRHSQERRTVLDLSIGPSLLHVEPVAVQAAEPALTDAAATAPAVPAAASTRLHLVGSAALRHDMSRSWNLSSTFRRAAGSIEGLVSDSATFDVRGLVSHRVELTGSAGLFQTETAGSATQVQYNTRYGTGRVQVALTSTMAVYGQFGVYTFDYRNGGVLAPGLSPHQHRRSARVGLTLWTPLRERRPR